MPTESDAAPTRRREVVVNGRRVKTIDIHAHCAIPEAVAIVGGTAQPESLLLSRLDERLRSMDEQGIDVEALSINPYWYTVDRGVAAQLIEIQNAKLAEFCAAAADRLVAFATVALQHPDLAAEQLERGVKQYGLRGASVGGSVAGRELSDSSFDAFWAKAEQLGVPVFIHPQGTAELESRLGGNGLLTNTIGNPLETTIFFSHLIFEGTLDKFPGLKICGAHAGGYLPSYMGRTDGACVRQPDTCSAKKRPVEEYFKTQLMADTMIFREDGLRHMVAEMGASQLVYGTDMPFPWPANPDFVLNAAFLNNAQKEQILGGNLMKLLKIAPLAGPTRR
jgi:aminocarboxymuconate-semialdehyde decarboxylase